jgi:hypothetical protein
MSQLPPPKPEDHELSLKRKELTMLEGELADRELELATMQSSLHAFERRSKAELDPRYEELADLQAKVSELQSRIKSTSGEESKVETNASPTPRTPRVPRKTRPRPAQPGERPPAPDQHPAPPTGQFSPAESLKRMYRDVAKAIHPDLADDDLERQHRHTLMVKANEAYDAGDEAKLVAIMHEWEVSPEAIRGQGTVPDLIRTIRKIHRAMRRLAEISQELTRLTGTSLFNLKSMSEEAGTFDRDLLAEMTSRLDAQIDEAKQRLAALEKIAPPPPPAAPPAPSPDSAEYAPMYVQTFPDPPAE